MKVYYWQGIQRASTKGKRVTTREIVCATSKRAARALTHNFIPLVEIHESFSADEITAASARPEIVLWRPLDARKPYAWTEVQGNEP